MQRIEGYLPEYEADLLIAVAAKTVAEFSESHAIVEVGSYCGRSTVVLASVVQSLGSNIRVYTIDPHEGELSAPDGGSWQTEPTLEKLRANLVDAGVSHCVDVIVKHSFEVLWSKPIGLLFIDGLHDYDNVSRDFLHFETWIAEGGYVAFHDYVDYFPGVKKFVGEVLSTGRYKKLSRVENMIVLRKQSVYP
jgi:predicted O-methyltransferase YrrM